MKYLFVPLTALLLSACNGSEKNDLATTPTVPAILPVQQMSPLAQKIKTILTDIETKDITAAGNTINSMNIDGVEVMSFSMKDYYNTELQSQEAEFNKYMHYLDGFTNTRNPLNNPSLRQESKLKHEAVMAYLQKVVKTASAKPDIYKVVYYLKADTKNTRYDQTKTVYLDKDLNKIKADYSFLNKKH